MKEVLIKEYNNLRQLNLPYKENTFSFNINFVNGAFVEILGGKSSNFLVEFFDQDTNKIIYQTEITNNMWSRTSVKYFVNFLLRLKTD